MSQTHHYFMDGAEEGVMLLQSKSFVVIFLSLVTNGRNYGSGGKKYRSVQIFSFSKGYKVNHELLNLYVDSVKLKDNYMSYILYLTMSLENIKG